MTNYPHEKRTYEIHDEMMMMNHTGSLTFLFLESCVGVREFSVTAIKIGI